MDWNSKNKFPNLQLYFNPLSYSINYKNKRPLLNTDKFNGFVIGFNSCRPKSRGQIYISSKTFNDAPVIDAIESQSTDEDQVFTLELSASDVDLDVLSFSASVDGNALASVDETTLTIVPNLDYSGDILVTVVASDGVLSTATSFTLTINNLNDAPNIDPIANESIFEDG